MAGGIEWAGGGQRGLAVGAAGLPDGAAAGGGPAQNRAASPPRPERDAPQCAPGSPLCSIVMELGEMSPNFFPKLLIFFRKTCHPPPAPSHLPPPSSGLSRLGKFSDLLSSFWRAFGPPPGVVMVQK